MRRRVSQLRGHVAQLRSHAFRQNIGRYETLPSSSTRTQQTRHDEGKQSLQDTPSRVHPPTIPVNMCTSSAPISPADHTKPAVRKRRGHQVGVSSYLALSGKGSWKHHLPALKPSNPPANPSHVNIGRDLLKYQVSCSSCRLC